MDFFFLLSSYFSNIRFREVEEINFSLLLRRFLFVAQLVEQLTLNQRVVGSSPTEETKIRRVTTSKIVTLFYLHTVCIYRRLFLCRKMVVPTILSFSPFFESLLQQINIFNYSFLRQFLKIAKLIIFLYEVVLE